MTPIKSDRTKWISTTEDDLEWYSYGTTTETKRWANAKTMRIVPNQISWRCRNINNIFTLLSGMEKNSIYGFNSSGNILIHI